MGEPDVEELEAKEDVEGLIQALKDEDDDVREAAAEALGRIGDVSAVEPLIQTLEDESILVQCEASDALVRIGEPSVEPLIQVLNNEHSDVRRDAVIALGEIAGKIGSARAIEELIQALKDKEEGVRLSVVTALVKIEDARAVEALNNALKGEISYKCVRCGRKFKSKEEIVVLAFDLVCRECDDELGRAVMEDIRRTML